MRNIYQLRSECAQIISACSIVEHYLMLEARAAAPKQAHKMTALRLLGLPDKSWMAGSAGNVDILLQLVAGLAERNWQEPDNNTRLMICYFSFIVAAHSMMGSTQHEAARKLRIHNGTRPHTARL